MSESQDVAGREHATAGTPSQRVRGAVRGGVNILRQIGHEIGEELSRFWGKTYLAHIRCFCLAVVTITGLICVWGLLAGPSGRAVTVTGRTEALSELLDAAEFGRLNFERATLRPDPDSQPVRGRVQLEVSPQTWLRFSRVGHGPLVLTFEVAEHARQGSCSPGDWEIGRATVEGTESALCSTATVSIPFPAGSDPLVVALSGKLVGGSVVSQGAGARPVLLEARVDLLVRYQNWPFSWLCHSWDRFGHLCERFVANSIALSPGNSVSAIIEHHSHSDPVGRGFLRIDPSEVGSGMLFLISAPAAGFSVSRIEGERFEIRETLFETIKNSPLFHTVNGLMALIGLMWWFSRHEREEHEENQRGEKA